MLRDAWKLVSEQTILSFLNKGDVSNCVLDGEFLDFLNIDMRDQYHKLTKKLCL